MMFARTVTPLWTGAGDEIKLVTRSTATGRRIPLAIGPITVLARQTHADFWIETVVGYTGFRLHLTQPGIDQRTMFGLLPNNTRAGSVAFLLQCLGLLGIGRTRLITGRRISALGKDN